MIESILTRLDDDLTGPATPAAGTIPTTGRPIVIATLLRRRGRTGVETHMRMAQGYLQSVSRRSAVVTPFDSRSPALYPVFAMRHVVGAVNTAYGVWWYRTGHVLFLRRALRSHLAAAPDAVVYAQCPGSAAAALAARTTQPVVLVVHFNFSEADEAAHSGEIQPGGHLYRSIRAFEADVISRLDGIVYVSEHTRAVVEQRIPAAQAVPSRTIHNSVPLISRDPITPIADLITVGALQLRKNHAYLLDVLSRARKRGNRYTLSIVGDGPERAALERLAGELGVADQVRFHGFQADPRALMAAHKCYCHTATVESFGLVVIEAMAEGLPVLAGRVGGVAEIVRPGVDGEFWPLDDAEAAATALIERMSDPALLAQRSVHAAQRVRDSFSPRAQGAKLLQFLDEAAVRDSTTTEASDPRVPAAEPAGSRIYGRRGWAVFRTLGERLPWVVAALLRTVRLLPPAWLGRIPVANARAVALVALDKAVRRYPKDYVRTCTDGSLIRGNTRDLVQRWIYVFGVWEPDLTAWLRARLSAGDVVVDVGANIGYYTTLAARAVGPSGAVIAVECLPSIAAVLRQNIALNQLHNVEVNVLAVGADRGETQVYSGGADNMGASSTNGEGSVAATVPVRTLDEILADRRSDRISFIKIDVEGDELKVLRGARRTLQTLRPGAAVLVEVSPSAMGPDSDGLSEILPPSSFDAYVVDNVYSTWRYSDPRVQPPRPWTGELDDTNGADGKADLLFVKK
jgi:FkbM family methyltransferase